MALRGGQYVAKYSSADANDVVEWCCVMQAVAVGVDAPCNWSRNGRARKAEIELMRESIWCFATPTREAAEVHPKDYFRWMVSGAELYDLLKIHYPLLSDIDRIVQPVCFETFPPAINCALLGRVTTAKRKGRERREILKTAGIDTSDLVNIDWVDAARWPRCPCPVGTEF